MILQKIEDYAVNKDGSYDIKKLKGKYGDIFWLRVGNYRVLFDKKYKILNILEIKIKG